jgi:hypothetical protein
MGLDQFGAVDLGDGLHLKHGKLRVVGAAIAAAAFLRFW